jgi:tetratricopeptide (TPR) repeat protein
LLDEAKPHLKRAFQLSDRLSAKDKLYISAWYSLANQDYSSAISSFRKIMNQYPFEVEAYTRLAKLLQGEGLYREALETFKQGLVVDPEAAEIYNGLGLLNASLGRHEEAIRMHEKYLKLAPREPNAHDSLGLSYQAAGFYSRAIEEYNRALALDPDFEVAVIHLGNTYFQQGRYRDAIREFKRYVAIAPSELEKDRGLDCIAYTHWKKGEKDLAGKMLEQISDQRAHVTMILHATDRADYPNAKQLVAELSQTSRGRGTRLESRLYYFSMGYLQLKNGESHDAIRSCQKGVSSLSPVWNIDSFEDCLANAFLATGRLDDAISEYNRILKLNPNYPLAHFHLAQAYEAKGRNDLALAEYETFLQVWKDADPDLPQIQIATTRLKQFEKRI